MKPLTEAMNGEFFPIVYDRERNVFHIEYPTSDDRRITTKIAELNNRSGGRWVLTSVEGVKYAEMARRSYASDQRGSKLVRSALAENLEYASDPPACGEWFV